MLDFLAEIVLVFVGYNVGYFFLKFFTGGKYPKEYMKDGGDFEDRVIWNIYVVSFICRQPHIFLYK